MDQETARNLLKEAVSGRLACPQASLLDRSSSTRVKPPPSRRRRRRPLRWCALTLLILVGISAGLVYRLAQGPLRIDGMSERVAAAIAERIGPGWRVDLRDSALELDSESSLALKVAGLDVFNPEGALVVRAPLAVVSLDTWGLLHLSVQPRSIEFRDLQMTALVHADGSIAFAASAPTQGDAAKPHTLPSVDAARGNVSPVSAAAASIFGVVLDSAGVIGALDRARITNARLILLDDAGKQHAAFEHVNGLLHRDPTRDARLFELRIDGPHGEWRFGGDLHEGSDGARNGTITLDDLPVADMLLLSGQSKLPVETDLKLSAKADIALKAGRVETMTGEIRTGDGNFLIDEKDFNPVTIERVEARVSWNEAARELKLDTFEYAGAGNDVKLAGTFALGSGDGWTFAFGGKDAVLRGAARQDAPVKIGEIKGHLTGRTGGVSIDTLTIGGEGLDGRLSGTIGTSADDDGLTLHITGANSDGRAVLRLWPEHIAPAVRNYLVDYLREGRLDSADIAVDMSGPEILTATKGGLVPDKAVHIDFAVSRALLSVNQDAPPLSNGHVTGTVTGQSTTIKGTTADIRLPDNRNLSISDGAFLIRDPQPDRIMAQIGFRLTGGADALAALLQAKMFKSLSSSEIDPALVKGQVDLRVDFPLNLKQPPEIADLPVVLSGNLTDLSMDKAFGKDRFEAGRFALSYDRNGFVMKGDGRVQGAPVTVDLRQAKPGVPGEAIVNTVFDDAVRARKGLPTAPQLAGPVPIRFVVPIGRPGPGKPPIRVEVDLARAGIDGALPGWTKPAGKPGRLTLTLVETASGAIELRDIALEAAPVLARGSATVTADGQLDRAEMSSFRLSPGDDMRVSLDRSGNLYKVAVRGAVADARPFLRSLSGGDTKTKDNNAKEVEADIALNILTGFNGEAMTNANLKASLRGGDVRTAQFKGKFGAAAFGADVTKSDRGVPLLHLESADAGAALRFLDVYKRMLGGRLGLNLYLNDGPQAGVVQIHNFVLRDEPALSRIVAQGPAVGDATDARGRRVQQASEVAFDRMRANFQRSGSRVSFTDAAISNAAMGFTLAGWIDTAKDRTQIDGTFVPLYALNNVVAQVPLVGPLLAGGSNEGMFALNFNVSGSIAKPTVNVNPLSAVAPGFLRQLFGAGGNEAFANGAPER